ncbi:hypothetical protein [Neobacillus sp. 19]|uniref:hypothetical protein n=1 Tax=Neobacillus sp. 19 TaxID=3394458 RepID=UPI003BF6E244
MKLATSLNNEKSKCLEEWLEKYIFPNDFLEDNFFNSSIVIYSVDLSNHYTLFHSLVHNQKAAKFSPEDLTNAILKGCRKFRLNEGCYYFNVNVHDNIKRETDSIGNYSLKRQNEKNTLFPLYYLLTENRAKEGGTSYTGLIGMNKEWMLSIEFENKIIFKVHGKVAFCEFVEKQLQN